MLLTETDGYKILLIKKWIKKIKNCYIEGHCYNRRTSICIHDEENFINQPTTI